jgi:hypothetical protein
MEGGLQALEEHRHNGGQEHVTWPDGLALGAEVRNKAGRIVPTTAGHLSLLNRMFSPRADAGRPAKVTMWRVPASTGPKDIRAGAVWT